MSLYIDKKFASLISRKLERFKWVGEEATFRCPICGDSEKNKYKTRGGFFPSKDFLMVGCFNCGYYRPFGAFLKHMDFNLYEEYRLEQFKYNNNNKAFEPVKKEKPIVKIKPNLGNPLSNLKSIAELEPFHPASVYIRNRKIPFEFYTKLYYTDNYKKWINDYVEPNKFKNTEHNDERIVIPFFGSRGTPFAYQGRYIGTCANVERYISINPIESNILLYGIERIKDGQPIYVVEGPFDSLFLKNCVAAAGSSLGKLLKYKKLDLIFCFDNEPYSKEICKLMEKVIDQGNKIIIWPSTVKEKDINDMVLAEKNVLDIIQKNCYNGLVARMKFNEWKKI